jgi:hypothetical protein
MIMSCLWVASAVIAFNFPVQPPNGRQFRPPPDPNTLPKELLARFTSATEKQLAEERKLLASLEAQNDPTRRWEVDVFRRRVDRHERELAALRAGRIAPLPPDPPEPEAWRWSLLFSTGSEPLQQSVCQVGKGVSFVISHGVGYPLLLPSRALHQGIQGYFINCIEMRLSIEKKIRERLEKSPNVRPRWLVASKRTEERFLRDLATLRAGGFNISVLQSLLPGSEP